MKFFQAKKRYIIKNIHYLKSNIALLYIIPVLAAVFGTLFYPFLSSIIMSFTNRLFQHTDYAYIGLNNYIELFHDPVFRLSFFHSIKLTLIVVAGDLALGLPIALLLNHGGRYISFFRVILFIPWLVPSTVTATIFKWIFHSYYGYLNYYLLKLGIISSPVKIMSDTRLVWWALSASIIWSSFSFVTFVLSAALKNINFDIYSAAKMDGANTVQIFRYITLPSIRPSLLTVIILEIIWEMSDYEMVKLLTNGGPGKNTYTLSMYMYDEAFYAKRLGYSGAIGVISFISIFVFTMLYFKIVQQESGV